jgi:hypothetical protein
MNRKMYATLNLKETEQFTVSSSIDNEIVHNIYEY